MPCGEKRQIGYHQYGYQLYKEEKQNASVDFLHGFFESVGSKKQIQANRRREIAQLHICQEDDSEMDRVYLENMT